MDAVSLSDFILDEIFRSRAKIEYKLYYIKLSRCLHSNISNAYNVKKNLILIYNITTWFKKLSRENSSTKIADFHINF